jgi:hypothetical protein
MKRYSATLRLKDIPAEVIEQFAVINGRSITAQMVEILENWGVKHKSVLREYKSST